jgi:hypothetical protein
MIKVYIMFCHNFDVRVLGAVCEARELVIWLPTQQFTVGPRKAKEDLD